MHSMLTSENGIREFYSGLKYERIDIRNLKLTKVSSPERIRGRNFFFRASLPRV
jgi:hypothetical protein